MSARRRYDSEDAGLHKALEVVDYIILVVILAPVFENKCGLNQGK